MAVCYLAQGSNAHTMLPQQEQEQQQQDDLDE